MLKAATPCAGLEESPSVRMSAEPAPPPSSSHDAWASHRRAGARTAALLLHAGLLAVLLALPRKDERADAPPAIPVELVTAPAASAVKPRPLPQALRHRESGGPPDRADGRPLDAPASPNTRPAPDSPALRTPIPVPPPPREVQREATSAKAAPLPQRPPAEALAPSPSSEPMAPPSPSSSRAQDESSSERIGESGGDPYLNIVVKILDANFDRVYPPAAPAPSLSPRVKYELCIDGRGRLLWIRLVASSGSDLIDDAFKAAIIRGAPYPPPPPALLNSEGEVRITARSY